MVFDQANASTTSALGVMKKNEMSRKLSDVQARAVLTTGSESKKKIKIKNFTWWKKLKSDGVHYDTFTRFHRPATIRNEGILFRENPDENEVLLYLPAYKRIRRVESQQQSSSFMGSVFSYSDIATPHVDDYRYKAKTIEKCPGSQHSQVECHVIESIPKTDAVRKRTRYSKTVNWIRNDNYMVVKVHYFDLEGKHTKTLEATQIRRVDTKNNKWMAHSLRMDHLKKKKYTILRFEQSKVNTGISDSIFTRQNLSRVR